MKPTTTSLAPHAVPLANREESLRHLPAPAQIAFRQFQIEGDATALDLVLFAILDDFIPTNSAVPLARLPGNTLLIDDLGFDSLAITEVVFYTEDLFGITISNEEIVRVRSLDDLRGFIRSKVSSAPRR